MIRNRDFGGELGIFHGTHSLTRSTGLANNPSGTEVIAYPAKIFHFLMKTNKCIISSQLKGKVMTTWK